MRSIITKGFLPLFLQLVSLCALSQDSLDIKIGQMLIVGAGKGTAITPKSPIIKEIANVHVGGIVLYEKNIDKKKPAGGLKKMIDTLQQISAIPLFVSIDQEGGKVNRLKEKYSFPKSVTAGYLGVTDNLDSSRIYYDSMAQTLNDLGINLNFAPDVDLCINKENPVIARYERCYSDKPGVVTRHALEMIKSHRKHGVLTVLKHFPGHGSSTTDTHLSMADVTKTWEQQELEPYRNLINVGYCDAVMTAHIIHHELAEDSLPATLSKNVITGMLREKLGFDGVVFSDDMQMNAIAKYYGFDVAIKKAILAGVDVLMFANNVREAEYYSAAEAHAIIKALVLSGEISHERIDESYRRIVALKSRIGQMALAEH